MSKPDKIFPESFCFRGKCGVFQRQGAGKVYFSLRLPDDGKQLFRRMSAQFGQGSQIVSVRFAGRGFNF